MFCFDLIIVCQGNNKGGVKTVSISKAFGCSVCWPSDAHKALEAIISLDTVYALIDQSHFGIKIRLCHLCQQYFITVFTEMIDWNLGDDDQSWSIIPITEEELKQVLKIDDNKIETWINNLDPDRKSLSYYNPPGRSLWDRGITIGLHD